MDFDIAVVIPTHNEERYIVSALEKFTTQEDQKILFVIVDNNSTDATVRKIKSWHKWNKQINLDVIYEKREGALYAKHKGLKHASQRATHLLSTDADNWPLRDFYINIRKDFVKNPNADVLRGRVRYLPLVRLQRQVFLPDLMKLISWQENIENKLFGPFFFGGYFGVVSAKFNNLAFSTEQIPLPQESSIFWSRHCFYLGYKFSTSSPDMRSSNRRFWIDPLGSIAGERHRAIRDEIFEKKSQAQLMKQLRSDQNRLINLRQEYFSRRLLMFILDAVYFRKKIEDKTIVSSAIRRACRYLEISTKEVNELENLQFHTSRKAIREKYTDNVLKKLWKNYKSIS